MWSDWRRGVGDVNMGVWLAVSAGVGTAIGAATHNLAMGLALGIVLGAVGDVLLRRQRRNSSC